MFNADEMRTDSILPNNIITRSISNAIYHTIVIVLKIVFITGYVVTPRSKKDAYVETVVSKLDDFAA